ncbi:NIPSNAP family protein [Roseomonas sp. OT10]|uniref:NIPSNAP family protein n=1 Tax=Roseomonas cutis TaxID=2897332 RepID=UPI001E4CEE86|nr:NIPSNAP family protein [Roseomonas sp. OT10]UFN47679.1 NIPSNAP family protein [Roseomonas sp. OT10]
MQRYEIATLTTTLGAASRAAPAIEAFAGEAGAKGRLLGLWTTELGPLNQILVLRGFETEADLAAERRRTLLAANPFGSAEWLTGLALDSYVPFPELPPVAPGAYGAVYEFRTYILKHGGLGPTLEAWKAAVPPRAVLSPLTIAMYATDGAPRFTHIWPYPSLNDRLAVRGESVRQGIWPPKGGPPWLTSDMRATVGLPTANSPLR